jgi:hypothetical protein
MPAVAWQSFSVMGTPWSGPHPSPRALLVQGDDGVQRRVVAPGPVQVDFQRLDRRDLAAADCRRQLARWRKLDLPNPVSPHPSTIQK